MSTDGIIAVAFGDRKACGEEEGRYTLFGTFRVGRVADDVVISTWWPLKLL